MDPDPVPNPAPDPDPTPEPDPTQDPTPFFIEFKEATKILVTIFSPDSPTGTSSSV
jgi:hypothetical protein